MSDDNLENEYMDLPDDPEQAFAVLHRRKFNELQQRWDANEGGNGYYYERQYVDNLVAFDEVYDLGILKSFGNPPTSDRDFGDFFQDFRRHAEIASHKILMENARRLKTGAAQILVLDASSRAAIHKLVDAIKEKLNNLNIPENKRDSLFNKLNSFVTEIDRNRTRTEAFYNFAIETARVAREVNDEIKPLQDTIDRILDMFERAKKLTDTLPSWKDRKKIEGQKKQLPSPETFDDDIPF